MFSKFISYFIFLMFSSSLLGSQLPNREVIILLETRNVENVQQTLNENTGFDKPEGIGAISTTFLVALHQKAAPIIANRSLIQNILDHQIIFNHFSTLDLDALQKMYGHYNKFKNKESLKDFQTNCQYISKSITEINKMLAQKIQNTDLDHVYEILDQIVKDKRFNLATAPSTFQKLAKDSDAMQVLELELTIYVLISWIDLENNWDIKQVNDDIFLLIPKNYIKDLNLDMSITFKSKDTLPKFTNLELHLGLKIDHMKTVQPTFFKSGNETPSHISIRRSLEQIFITHKDIKTNDIYPHVKHIWSIYMSGHGTPPRTEVEIFPQLKDLKKLFLKKINSSKYKACILYEKNKKEGLVNNEHYNNCKHHSTFQKYIDQIKALDKEIKEVTTLINQFDDAELEGTINSLTLDQFKDLLHFLNDDIHTAIFYYGSCFAGGNHLVTPYLDNGKPVILNYPIITATPSDNKTLIELPIINIPPYSQTGVSISFEPSEIHINDIDIARKQLALMTTMHFNKFFEALRKGIHNNNKQLLLACYALHPHVDQFGNIINQNIAAIPLTRLAYTDHFQPIPYDTSSVIINKVNDSRAINVNTDAALLYSNYVSGKLILNRLNNQAIPQLISMIPGYILHVFEEISSSTLNLQEIVNSFLTFPELSSSKIFWIKKLECLESLNKNQKEKTFKDVIIMRKVFNSNTLALCSDNQFIALENCAYFSHDQKECKLTWDGAFIDNNNYKIDPWNHQGHKEECFNCFPHLKKFISPILQQI